ncbi:MAG: tRNA (guanosine(37)-N1)-methyltransferase TrmD [Deltaproteobacteria bacterium]|jgi:tRNA (guanine37-N1)-methyltransferase|nr:tRNA (guanosine(37)-N1)-methyltransferase TrmD [Deltaproteobacteria bacterium]
MRFEILTLFPEIFSSFLSESLLARALAKGLISVELINIRNFTSDKHRTVDDRPYGGGYGMVLKPEPIGLALESLLAKGGPKPFLIYLSPAGKLLNQPLTRTLAQHRRLILICGRYEGVDQRVLDHYGAFNLSIGDYIVNGGEVPAMVVIEAVSRLIPGFLGEMGSAENDSFSDGLLEHPVYTRPRIYKGLEVPDTLLSGNHRQIELYRQQKAVEKTISERPELLTPSKDQEKE